MRVIVNGEGREVKALTLEALLHEVGFGGSLVATAVNAQLVPRSRWAKCALQEGDNIEVLAPMQGG